MRLTTVLAGFCFFALPVTSVFAQTATLSASDKAFLDMAAQIDMTEANLGKVAQDQGETQAVKDYGQMLVQDHTANYNQLTQLGTKLGADVPKSINHQHDVMISGLTKLKGAAFDRRFAATMVQGHTQAIAAFKRQAEHGDNADIKAFANDTLPKLEEHLQKAKDLMKPQPK